MIVLFKVCEYMHDYIFACVIELKWNWHHAFPYALGHPRMVGVSA